MVRVRVELGGGRFRMRFMVRVGLGESCSGLGES